MSTWQIVAAVLIVAAILIAQRKRRDFPWTEADTTASERDSDRASYVHRVLVAFDVMWNVILLGEPDETISARCGRWSLKTTGDPGARWLARHVNGWLARLQRDHGYRAMSGDLERARRIVAIETTALRELTGGR